MQFLGMFRHVRTAHAQGLTKEMFVSLGQSAVSAADVYAQGALIVMAEGEIRNRSALTRALKLSSDASMSLITARAYRMWGADYPRHIEGNVVTAVIDRTEDRMILSADRTGSIGVFYAWRGRSVAFASRPDLLLKMGAAGRKIGREGVCELFATGGFFTPGKTAFQDIRMLEGGCVLVADTRGMRVKRYYFLIPEAMKPEKTRFTVSDYLETLPQAEYALFLSDGLSRKMADEIRKKGRAVFYHVSKEGETDLSQEMNAPVECIRPKADLFLESIKESVTNTGLPGPGLIDGVMLSVMKEAFCVFPSALIGGKGVFFRESIHENNLLRFLSRDVYRKIDAQGYLIDRFNDLTEKMHIPLDDSEELAQRILVSVAGAGQFVLRMRLMASSAGGRIRSPLMDERFLVSIISSLPEMENAHSRKTDVFEECALAIYEEAREMLENEDQPIFEAVDAKAVRKALESEQMDLSSLARLIQINSFLYQFEAELSLN